MPEMDVFTESDGLAHRQCTGAVPFTALADGRFLFPTFGGLSILDPKERVLNAVPPPMVVHDVRADGLALPVGGLVNVAPGVRRLSFSFSALSFVNPEAVDVRYRLEGFDEAWERATSERQVSYTNLDPGSYRFQVIGANSDGVWNRQGASVSLLVEHRLVEQPWARALGMILFVVSIWQLAGWRLRVVRERNVRLRRIIEEQHRTADQNRRLIQELETKNADLERFTYTVSHDLKGPLVTIRGFAGALQENLSQGEMEQASEDLALIHSASDRMGMLLGELEHLTRVGVIQNPSEPASMSELALEAAALAGRDQAQESDDLDEPEITVQPNMPVLDVDRSRLVEVYRNVIENALKFSRPGVVPKITVGCEARDEENVFFVRDNGIGLPEGQEQEIFGLFKRLSRDAEGAGMGLAVVRRTVENHGGRIWAESAGPGRGTTIYFTLEGLRDSL